MRSLSRSSLKRGTQMPSQPSNRDLRNLLLRDYRPRTQLTLPEHHVSAARFPAIDMHNHLGKWLTSFIGDGREWTAPDVGELVGLMDSCNIAGIVNLDGRWGQELLENLNRYDNAYPGQFATFCHVDWNELRVPGFGHRLAASLRRSVECGAKGLKVWKDLGLKVRDGSGDLVLPDDPRLEELWIMAGELGVPVAIHTADPRAFFDPVDEENEFLELLLTAPEWSYAGADTPSFERLITAFEKLVLRHPGTTFVGLHVGCHAEDLGRLDRLLQKAPNLYIDIAARLYQLGRQPRAARSLIEKYPRRFMFATDHFPPARRAYELYFRFLETEDEYFPYSSNPKNSGRWNISGLGLSEKILESFYQQNAIRILPSLTVQ
ncbi:amidohydrolase family protein [Nonomuraea sp. NPDC049714]|uniref:amidohydrolase family protein n=1 Tax=Nonomuraea sp. NPDC049714 TaxID=3364357 RepID=UPI0037ADD9A3